MHVTDMNKRTIEFDTTGIPDRATSFDDVFGEVMAKLGSYTYRAPQADPALENNDEPVPTRRERREATRTKVRRTPAKARPVGV